jgi:predicted HicB family RNase H-like nuclease
MDPHSMSMLFHSHRQFPVIVETILTVWFSDADNESIPEPLSVKKFSGKFQIRITPHIHRHLAIEAAEAGVSLNRLISAKLAHP